MLFMDDLKLFAKNKNQLESMVRTVKIFSEDIRMKFGLEKCATLVVNRGKRIGDTGINLSEDPIADLGEESYKYLGVMEDEKIRMKTMKDKIAAEYMKRVDKILDAGLNGGNVVKGINTWAVALVRYTAGIVEWTQEELKQLDRRTRKHMTMRKMLHPRSNVDRLYLKRNEGGRGLMAVEDCVRLEEAGLSDFLKMSGRDQQTYSWFRKEHSQGEEQKLRHDARLEAWKEKALHGQFIRKTEELGVTSWKWLLDGKLKKETEGMILAAQDQVLPTRNVQVKIYGKTGTSKCRMCDHAEETIMHIVSECEKLAQGEYKKRHDKVALRLHWELCGAYGFERSAQWYHHRAEGVLENEKAKLLWDVNIQTKRVISARRPDLVLMDKEKKETMLIDIAIPGDIRVKDKEMEKIEKYQDLRIELEKLWNTKCKVVPIVVGGLGSVYGVENWLRHHLGLGAKTFADLQTTALIGTAHILRKVLSISV